MFWKLIIILVFTFSPRLCLSQETKKPKMQGHQSSTKEFSEIEKNINNKIDLAIAKNHFLSSDDLLTLYIPIAVSITSVIVILFIRWGIPYLSRKEIETFCSRHINVLE